MKVRLAVIGDHRQGLGDRAEHVFAEAGGVIGRSPSCDWVLPDDTKTLSARHASIGFADGIFVVTDTSTNGVYLNTVDAPLGRGATTPLRAGDILYLGPYAISVEPLVDSVEGRQRLGLGDGWMAVRGGPQAERPVGQGIEAIVPNRPVATDPLAGFAGLAPPVRPQRPAPAVAVAAASDPLAGLAATDGDGDAAADIGRRPEEDLLAPQRRQPVAPLSTPGAPSPAAGGAAIIPPDFNLVAPPPPPAGGPIPTSFLLPEPPSGTAAAAYPAPATPAALPLTPAARPPLPAAPPLQPVLPPAAPPWPPSAAAPPLPQPPVAPPPSAARVETPRPEAPPTDVMALLRLRALAAGSPVEPAPPPRRDEPGDDRLLAAVGVDPAALGPREAKAAIEALAAFVVEAADGLVAVLEARRSVRDELRLEHTRLGPSHNNPFKFFASGREAVRQLVERRAPGFTSLAAGARDGFDDIKAHELATMTAIHAVAAALVARLSPAAVESAVEAGGLFGRADKAKLWERYVESHGRLAETLDVTVNELVAREFARAYRRHADGHEEHR